VLRLAGGGRAADDGYGGRSVLVYLLERLMQVSGLYHKQCSLSPDIPE